jgi:hypothetical protein
MSVLGSMGGDVENALENINIPATSSTRAG